MRVRLVVPTSRRTAFDFDITSGMRNDPPISTSSPRETMTSPPSARVFSASRTAAALLLTTMVEMSGVARAPSPAKLLIQQLAKEPVDMHVALAAPAGLDIEFQVRISGGSVSNMLQRGRPPAARVPRLVCRITPVALMTGRSE